MELYQLRAFVAVVDERLHVSRAAARLHVAQPTLSRQLAALERTVGVPLFRRSQRRLQLTSAGQVFLAGAREILTAADTAIQQARRAARGEVGLLRLGFVQSATYGAVPRLIRAFRSTCPDVQLAARPMTTLQQIPALQQGEIDIGLLRPQQPSTGLPGQVGLRTRVLSRDPTLAVLPATHPLAAQPRVSLAALAGESFILYPREPGSTGHDLIIDYCRQAGFHPRIIQEANDAQTIVALVAADLGVSLLPSPTPPIDPSLVVFRPLSDPLPTFDMALAWREDNPSATLARFLTVTAETDLTGTRTHRSDQGARAGRPLPPVGADEPVPHPLLRRADGPGVADRPSTESATHPATLPAAAAPSPIVC